MNVAQSLQELIQQVEIERRLKAARRSSSLDDETLDWVRDQLTDCLSLLDLNKLSAVGQKIKELSWVAVDSWPLDAPLTVGVAAAANSIIEYIEGGRSGDCN